jgi:tRNA (cytidine/uridine-2'-O-)-methyltransferase
LRHYTTGVTIVRPNSRAFVMFHVLLYQPEIPPNTGNIMRLCANSGARLHLIAPLGFELDDAKMRRAGLDYGDWADVTTHPSLEAALTHIAPPSMYAFTTRASRNFAAVRYRRDDALLFGPETRGLPERVLKSLPEDARLKIPMRAGSRSLNLSNAVAVAVYEAWRQLQYYGGR